MTRIHDGCVLWGGVGSGKTLTALAYYVQNHSEKELVVITTARKRDDLDWESEAIGLGISVDPELSLYGSITVDSWNNIKKYVDCEDTFFIFDEQRLVGYGAWVKHFLKIAKRNDWILLSATPGDTWIEYAPIFIANGFFDNITQFRREHVVYEPYRNYPVIAGYIHEPVLQKYRNLVLVEMPFKRHTTREAHDVDCEYDKETYEFVWNKRWNVYEEQPIRDVGELFRVVRKIVNSDPSREQRVRTILKDHPKLVIFYTFNYELDILRGLSDQTTVAEYNGHKKEPIPDTDSWMYLVQYQAGAEGWNCIETDSMVFYSLPYSWKQFDQAHGRIDRLDTPFQILHYFICASFSGIDLAIKRSLSKKKTFNEKAWADKGFPLDA